MSRRMMLSVNEGQRLKWKYGAVDDVDRTTYTFSSVPLDDPAGRVVIVGVLLDADTSTALNITSVTVAGTALNLTRTVAAGNSAKTRAALFSGVVPAASSGDVVVVASRACRTGGISVYSAYGLTSAVEVVDYEALPDGVTTTSFNLATNDGDVVIAVVSSQSSSVPPWSWTGLTEDYELLGADSRCLTTASISSAVANQPITATSTGASTRTALVAAAWR